jgi:hypothetical protein
MRLVDFLRDFGEAVEEAKEQQKKAAGKSKMHR